MRPHRRLRGHGGRPLIIATAGQPRGQISSRIGHRFAMSPPVGTLFVAWSDDVVVDAWLRRASPALSESEREMYRQALGAIRRDGYGLLVGTLAPEPTEAAAGSSPPAVPGDLRRFVHDLRMGFGAEDLPPPTNEQWLALGASVFDADGEVTLMISLHGFDRLTAADFDDCTRQLAATAQRVTELTGGRAPVG